MDKKRKIIVIAQLILAVILIIAMALRSDTLMIATAALMGVTLALSIQDRRSKRK